MGKMWLGGVALVALMSDAALATDMPVAAIRPAFRSPATVTSTTNHWAGLYGGFIAGWGWSSAEQISSRAITDSFHQGGSLVGGLVGFNWQSGKYVAGIEADWAWALINDTGSGCPTNCYTTVNSLGTLRGRVGYSWGKFMPYVTGGLAFGQITAGQPGFDNSSWQPGVAFGAGIETLFAPNWSVKLEYVQVRLKNTSYTTVVPVSVNQNDVSTVRIGVNYHYDKAYRVAAVAATPAARQRWAGVYVGANGGWGKAEAGHRATNAGALEDFYYFDQSGALLGGTVGVNLQSGRIVYGAETDWAWANIAGTGLGGSGSGCQAGCYTTVGSLWTLRGRVGYAWGAYMPYLTGGLAWGQIKSGRPGSNNSTWEPGLILGGGIEGLFAPNWSLKVEYIVARINDSSYTATVPVMVNQRDIHVLRAGVNYHFDLGLVFAKY